MTADSDLRCVYSMQFKHSRGERCGNGAEPFGVGPTQLLVHVQCEVTGGGSSHSTLWCPGPTSMYRRIHGTMLGLNKGEKSVPSVTIGPGACGVWITNQLTC